MVIVSFTAPVRGHKLVIYRGAEQIKDPSGVLQASIVAIVDDSVNEVKDYPIPGIDYYYAVIDDADIKAGAIALVPGDNSSTTPVRIETGAYRVGLPGVSAQSRSIPLPYLSGSATAATGGRQVPSIQLPEKTALSPESEKAIDRLLEGIPPYEVPRPSLTIFDEDRGQPSTGESYTLSIIVKESVEEGKWDASVEQLEKFLSIPRSAEVEQRARFYLGEAYAMGGAWKDALFSLLLVKDAYPLESKPWRDYCLRELRMQDE